MAARTGMANLIKRLRSMTETTASDYVIGADTYWSDDHLQGALDRQRQSNRREPLDVDYEYVGGDQQYRDYYTELRNIEEAASGTPVFVIENGSGSAVTPGTHNYDAGHFRFSTDTLGASYYLTCYTYNLEAAAADVWEQKASHAAKGYGFSADGGQFHREQVFAHCMDMARKFRNMAGIRVSTMFRADVDG